MIPELGHYVLILALCLAGLQCFLPLLGIILKKEQWLNSARSLALGQSFFIALSFLCLAYAFVQDDFSVAYVAQNSNASLPLIYKICAIWGGHEGSLLLWVFLLSAWTVMVCLASRKRSLSFFSRVIAILGLISLGFLLLLLATSNPFDRLLPHYPVDGRDLNPLLQDPGLIIHPPLLYMGYVGFSVPFAFALSALLMGQEREQSDLLWAKWMRPWVLVAFGFLTLGIMLGSWWAYYELGWGGWWFWDPVENASFMPWLIGLALIHSLMVSDKRQLFQGWTLLLSLLAFGFSLLGTFLVRSGVLTSVHAFASDPKRGLFLLLFLLAVMVGAFTIYAILGKKFFKTPTIDLYSRETLIFISALCLLVAALTILLGTVFPIIYDAITHQKISVGFPYFNAVFIPLMLPVLLFVPLGPFSQWGSNAVLPLLKKVRGIALLSILLGVLLPWIITRTLSMGVILGLSLSFWIILGTLKSAYLKMKKRPKWWQISLGAWGMIFAHIGMGVTVIGITLVSAYHIERTLRISPNQTLDIQNYQIVFQSVERIEGANFIGYRGHFSVFEKGDLNENTKVAELFPEKRIFVVQGSAMSETAIDPGIFRDIYIALGEKLDKITWSARIYYKPFVRWIWLGAILMALGGFMAAWGRRSV
jgi:cytochrome c-type biogenesis protein CcmF